MVKSTFPPEVTFHFKHLLDFRVQLLLKDKLIMQPGETKLLPTACIITDLHYIAKHVKKGLSVLNLNDTSLPIRVTEFT